MKLLKHLGLFVVSACLLLSGCIGDDLRDCPSDNNLTLSFFYLNFPQHINRVTVGIYDSGSQLVEYRQIEKKELAILQGMQLNLPAGSYTAVCWGNAFEHTQINGFEIGNLLREKETAHPGYFSSSDIPTNDALYYGIHAFTVNTQTTTHETVSFTPAHIRLVVQLKGLINTAPNTFNADEPYIKVNNLEPAYDYTMTPYGGPATYYPEIAVDPSKALAESVCDVLRFKEINPITIEVMENKTTNRILHTLNLQSFIADNNIKIEEGERIIIPIEITFDGNMNVTMVTTIANWGGVPVDPLPQE